MMRMTIPLVARIKAVWVQDGKEEKGLRRAGAEPLHPRLISGGNLRQLLGGKQTLIW
jgi:hypothetical protein